MTTCIRCGKPSPIITQQKAPKCTVRVGCTTRGSLRKSVSDSAATKQRPFDSSLLFHFSDSDSSGSERKIRRALFSPENNSVSNNTRKTDKRASVESVSSSLNSSNRNSSLGNISWTSSPTISATIPECEEYGWCSGNNCGFKFCVKCSLEYHPGQTCRSSMEITSSPNREEEICNRSRGNLMCSKQSRRTLKRLCT